MASRRRPRSPRATWSFRIYVVRFGNDVYRFIFARKRLTPEIDETFRDSRS